MDVFALREAVVADYARFSRSFTRIQADDIRATVDAAYAGGRFWPAPLIQLNPNFVPGGRIDDLVTENLLHRECAAIFRAGKTKEGATGTPLRLHKHQEDAIRVAQRGDSYVLTTGTGSGKSLSYFIPIIDDVLRRRQAGEKPGRVSAIVVYPMNALCNSQMEELEKFLRFGYRTLQDPGDPRSRRFFAFRLHQFISGAGNAYATLEAPGRRFITVDGQQYKPGERDKALFNLCFCRECGQEYFPVWAELANRQPAQITPRELTDRAGDDEELQFGFFMPDPDGRFDPNDPERHYPEEWLDYAGGQPALRPHFRRYRPLPFAPDTKGGAAADGPPGWFIPGPFRFCLNPDCSASYDGALRSDLTKLSSLSSEGRSSATTVLTLATLRRLIGSDLDARAKKLLGFTDNRQDASLQAGHFNDFVQILLLRGALLAAIMNEPGGALTEEIVTQRVFQHLHLEPGDYAANPDLKGIKAEATRRTLRDVLGYRLYYDLRRGWRVTNPNLEQLRLLRVDYAGLGDCAGDEAEWSVRHPLLAAAAPELRATLLRELLDAMRRGLCIKTIYLDPQVLEQVKVRSFADLREPWGFTEDEQPYGAAVMIPRPSNGKPAIPTLNVSHRSRFGRRLKAQATWGPGNPHYPARFDEKSFEALIDDMLAVMTIYGLVEPVELDKGRTGYRVGGGAIEWRLEATADGSGAENAFFRDLYLNVAALLRDGDKFLHRLEAREHTAQVESEEREKREARFRVGSAPECQFEIDGQPQVARGLPVMFCSPTMELGVDIATLNTVYMRNVPPTPANYAQRSGRAGRSGQPALVLTYCAARAPHDQYFFADPPRMVAGSVKPPMLDLANEELIRSHLHSVWLVETGQKLESSVRELLNMEDAQALPLRDDLQAAITSPAVQRQAGRRALGILAMLNHELTPEAAPWYGEEWLDNAIRSAALRFDDAFDRWRSLYRATADQMRRADAILHNAAAGEPERREAKQRYDEAYRQQSLLLGGRASMNADFYTYRYLASEGFLPGYNFPRLPLMAYIPARREKVARESFLSRPRFLGLSEFGPQSIIYHEGSTYRVRRAILGIRDQESATATSKLPVQTARLCPACGYAHFDEQYAFEKCVSCGARLEGGRNLTALYRIEQVSTRRADRITSDEEERQRQGYEMVTTLRFAEEDGERRCTVTMFRDGDDRLLDLAYGPAATVWRVNLGWRRRKAKSIYGFTIDVATGEWTADAQAPDDAVATDTAKGKTVERIIPFVQDRKNVLVLRPARPLDAGAITTLQYALKRGIEAEFQLEESELAAEPLPDAVQRNAILFYEAAEGGAGVLTRLAADPEALRRVALRALAVCHYGSTSGAWRGADDLVDQEPGCEAGCYRCLLSYYNQPEHPILDRRNRIVLDLLCRLAHATGEAGSGGKSADERFEELLNRAGSALERAWLMHLREAGYRLPDRAQLLLSDFAVCPDFAYDETKALVFIDGPHHRNATTKTVDEAKRAALRAAGYKLIVFTEDRAGWPDLFRRFSFVFGKGNS